MKASLISRAIIQSLFLFLFSYIFFSISFASWWNMEWLNRMEIEIENKAIYNLYDFPVNINLTFENEMKNDFSDLRFLFLNTSTGEEVEIPYGIENKVNGKWASVWFKIPFVQAKNISKVYVYYGNPYANSSSNLTEVCPGGVWNDLEDKRRCWVYYEPFIDDVFVFGWSRSEASPYVFVDTLEEVLRVTSHSVCHKWNDWAQYDRGYNIVNLTDSMDVAIEFRTFSNANCGYNYHTGFHGFINSSGHHYSLFINLPDSSYGVNLYNKWGPPFDRGTHGNWLRVRVILNSTHAIAFWNITDGTNLTLIRREINPYGLKERGIRGVRFQQAWGIDMKIDWIGIRKFAELDPLVTIGEVEKLFNFKIQLSKQSISLIPSKYEVVNISIVSIGDSGEKVTLRTLYVPKGLEVSFNPSECIIPCASQINVKALQTASTGIFPLVIKLVGETGLSKEIVLHVSILNENEKILFIVNSDWKNILSLAPLKKPTIVTNSIDENIIHFINSFKPVKIFVVGNVVGFLSMPNVELISDYNEVYFRFFNNSKGVYVCNGHSNLKGMYLRASLIASVLNKPVVFDSNYADKNYSFCSESVYQLEEIYLSLLNNTNFLIVSNHNPLASLIASQKNAFVLFTNAVNSTKVYEDIIRVVSRLKSKGFYVFHPTYAINSAYLLLMDRVRSFQIGKFYSDSLYGDFDKNGIIDVVVARLPNNDTIASLMIARSLIEDNKKALVASEYLQSNFLLILLSGGGGMLEGSSIAKVLEKQNYEVDRLVERRSNIQAFLKSLKPQEISLFLTTLKKVRDQLSKFIGKLLTSIISNILIVLKGLQFIEQGLEAYFEYDWSTFPQSFDIIIDDLINGELGIDTLISIWPLSWKSLTKENLIESLRDKSIVYYIGWNNKTHWILPTKLSAEQEILNYETWLSIVTNNRYSGEEAFGFNDVPLNNIRIVFDNSPNAALSEVMNGFLLRGAASFIGSSSPDKGFFPSSTFANMFFNNENNIGRAFLKASNELILIGNLKESLQMMLLGDPLITKDPEIKSSEDIRTLNCNNNLCVLNVTLLTKYSVQNNTIIFDTEKYFTEELKPIIPLRTFEYFISSEATFLNYSIHLENKTFYEIEVPFYVSPFYNVTNFSIERDFYPNFTHNILFNKTIDNRSFLFLTTPLLFYNSSNKTAMVVEKIVLSLYYYSPIDFAILLEEKYSLGESINIPIEVFNPISGYYDILVEVLNQTHTWYYNFTTILNETNNIFSFNFTPEVSGNYKVRVVLFKHNPLLVGPKEAIFSVEEVDSAEQFCELKVIISEIMYNPAGRDNGREWIEIYNNGSCEVDLTKIFFLDSSGFHKLVVSGNKILLPKSYAIITTNVTQFKIEYPNANCIVVKSSFSLRNTNETIGLANYSKHIFEKVFYSKEMGANGNKKSLELKSDGKWGESLVDFGTPCYNNTEYYTPFDEEDKERGVSSSTSQYLPLIQEKQRNLTYENVTKKVIEENNRTITEKKKEEGNISKIREEKGVENRTRQVTTAFVTKTGKLDLDLDKIIIGILISIIVFLVLKFVIFK
ncbi:MAG: DUF2341 domain-containing protein [Candidatus Aenigmarchaeota archaeon]|nr:DUF2341 domain-containing protein [Candidatus Aenigmarchaeota archaeon]MDW8149666.1 DUF2341 domain-containing protein [Candidatus Aenigmarchaeota archaeon]